MMNLSASRWLSEVGAATLRHERPPLRSGIAAVIGAVALATVAIALLSPIAPVVSLSVVYLPAVLLISTFWGLGLGLVTSLLSAAAFNFFHLPPTGQFTIVDNRNWVALAAFTIVALAASSIAELARSRAVEAERRRAEADLAATLAHELLQGADTTAALSSAARRLSEALGLSSAAIEEGVAAAGPRRTALALHGVNGDQIATIVVPSNLSADTSHRLRTQVVPTLEALIAVAQRRDALQAELVETAALRRSDDIKTALLRTVSHDLRTPLTAVVAAGHALGTDSLSPQEREELSGAVVEEGTRLARLVDDLLAMSRLQAGRATPRSNWVSIEELVTAAAEGLRGDPVDVRLTLDPDVPEIRADAAQLERAFANLLENSRRYGDDGPVVVHARRAGANVRVSFVDQGPGIPAAEQSRIFEPFYRGRSAAGASGSGSGLGLAIVRGFVEANGGQVAVTSLPGQGTSFIVTLPLAAETAPADAATTVART